MFPIFVFSEGLLFLSLFWVSLRSSCSLNWPGGIYAPYPCELTYNNTLVLAYASLSLRCAFMCEEAEVGDGRFSIISPMPACALISIRIKGLRALSFYINDTISRVSSLSARCYISSCYLRD